MIYNFTSVTSIAAFDTMIQDTQSEKDILGLRRNSLSSNVNNRIASKAFIQEDLAIKTALVSSLTETLSTLQPDTSGWFDTNGELRDAMADRFKLMQRLANPIAD